MAAIAGHDPRDPISANRPVPDFLAGIDAGPQKLRVGVPTDHVWDECDPAIAAAVRGAIEALARAGADVREIRWPRAADTRRRRARSSALRRAVSRGSISGTLGGVRTAYTGASRVARHSTPRPTLRSMRLLLEARAGVRIAPRRRRCPSDPRSRRTLGRSRKPKEIPRPSEWTRITRIFDLTGQPAISVPCGLDPDGLPIGLQFAARMWDEAAALRAARAYELVRGPFALPPLDG